MTTITVANQKGGVGKTTTAVFLAHGLALAGKSVLLVDLDPQGQVKTLLNVEDNAGAYDFVVSTRGGWDHLVLHDARPGLDLITGDKRTADAQAAIRSAEVNHLADKLKAARYDFVVIDTAPSVGDIQALAIYAANWLLIPSKCDFLSSEGIFKLLETSDEATEKGWRGRLFGILPTFYDEQTRESKATIEDLTKHFNNLVLAPIHQATVIRESAAEGKTIFEQAPTSRAADEYRALVDGILKA